MWLHAFQVLSLPEWSRFTVWGVGRDGKRFFNQLSRASQEYVTTLRSHATAVLGSWCVPELEREARYLGSPSRFVVGCDHCSKVVAFCDVNEKKIGTVYHNAVSKHSVPIVHFRDAKPPIVCCVALDRTDGRFEANVAGLGLKEGKDLWHVV